ncbi:MAG: 16S rRNA (cytidine(1402)-2'-O)-methyltransferase [Desulfobacteraceae bacterium 4572_130]|nr:MAG: 16S rRNA (cytidine(1402)-2'-O)-methyltransferase [Desulfobacteraceae bacterium 4572_130]
MVKNNNISGILYVVATPIGNLEDITFRAVKILKKVDIVAAEDTRHTRKLFSYYGIKTNCVSCYDHNEVAKIPEFIKHLKNGYDISLVSNAGTPLISDPGYKLVKEARKQDIQVIPIPGACAAIAGLSVSGFTTNSFLFLGFVSRKKTKRLKELEQLKYQKSTLIFYESPKRIVSFLMDILAVMDNRPAVLAREITKMHEEYINYNLSDIINILNLRKSVKGECTLFVQGYNSSRAVISDQDLDKKIFKALKNTNVKTSVLSRDFSTKYHLSKKVIYDKIIKLQRDIEDS